MFSMGSHESGPRFQQAMTSGKPLIAGIVGLILRLVNCGRVVFAEAMSIENIIGSNRGTGYPAGGTRALALLALILQVGCGPDPSPAPQQESAPLPVAVATEPNEVQPAPPKEWTEDAVHQAFLKTNPSYNGQAQFHLENGQVLALQLTQAGVTDLSALAEMPALQMLDLRQTQISDLGVLKGKPLIELYLEQSKVEDLSPLKGMPLAKLYLSQTPVKDLSPLEGLPLVELNLLGTGVTDLKPLNGMPLKMLWLNETPVSNIEPLRSCPLISLTLHRTQVRDLSPLTGTGLQRLHVAETPVTDLTPLYGLHLTRLVFTPDRITQGLDVVSRMVSLQEVGTTLEGVMPREAFMETVLKHQ